jgi:hypothetical protein
LKSFPHANLVHQEHRLPVEGKLEHAQYAYKLVPQQVQLLVCDLCCSHVGFCEGGYAVFVKGFPKVGDVPVGADTKMLQELGLVLGFPVRVNAIKISLKRHQSSAIQSCHILLCSHVAVNGFIKKLEDSRDVQLMGQGADELAQDRA